MENTKTATLIWKILVGIADAFSVFQVVTIKKVDVMSYEINNTWLIISCSLTLLLVGIFMYGKIMSAIESTNNRLIALKKFRDFESKGQQKYNSMLLVVLDDIFTKTNLWKKGEQTEFQKLQGKIITEYIEEKIKDYNNAFKGLDNEYKQEP